MARDVTVSGAGLLRSGFTDDLSGFAAAEGLFKKEGSLRLKELLVKYHLPVSASYSAEELLKAVLSDKNVA